MAQRELECAKKAINGRAAYPLFFGRVGRRGEKLDFSDGWVDLIALRSFAYPPVP